MGGFLLMFLGFPLRRLLVHWLTCFFFVFYREEEGEDCCGCYWNTYLSGRYG